MSLENTAGSEVRDEIDYDHVFSLLSQCSIPPDETEIKDAIATTPVLRFLLDNLEPIDSQEI